MCHHEDYKVDWDKPMTTQTPQEEIELIERAKNYAATLRAANPAGYHDFRVGLAKTLDDLCAALRAAPASCTGELSTLHITETDKEYARDICEDLDEPDGWSREQVLSQWVRKIRHEAYLAFSAAPASGEGKLREVLVLRIIKRISGIQFYNSGVVQFAPSTLGRTLSLELLNEIATVAAHEALSTTPADPGTREAMLSEIQKAIDQSPDSCCGRGKEGPHGEQECCSQPTRLIDGYELMARIRALSDVNP